MDDAVLHGIYTDVKNPACFSSIEVLYNAAKQRIPNLTRKQVKDWLSKQETYTLHRSAQKRFRRNPIVVNGIDVLWEIDLADLSNLKKHNDNYRYLLQVIDVLSRFAFSVPIKSKDPETVSKAFEQILKSSDRKPFTVASDAGKEFTGKAFQNMLKKRKIHFFVSTSDQKCPVIERWNRTLKTRMWRFFTNSNTYRYLDILQDLVNAYNNSIHRTIQCRPAEVNKENAHHIIHRLYKDIRNKKPPKFKFEIGDKVRLSKRKGTFEKGYESNWTREIFVVSSRDARPLPIYKIKDLNDQPIGGIFYEKQLQKVVEPDAFKIEKILRWRGKGKRKQALIKWLGYGHEFDQWIDEAQLIKI